MKLAYVLSDGNTATTDYFILPYLEALGYQTRMLQTSEAPRLPLLARNNLVVISRYLPSRWRSCLREMKCRGVRVAYFMDDDLLDLRTLTELPWRYAWKILTQSVLQQHFLRHLCDEFWVSTPYLQLKYESLNPRLVAPSPKPEMLAANVRSVKVCYHATSSHRREMDWLAGVIRLVQSDSDYIHFEIFGGAEVKRIYRDIPRVSIVQPMRWPDYLAWSSTVQRDIALAPLLDSTFNAGRGATKFYDYTRLGAAGIYMDISPYRDFVRDGVDGVLLGESPQEWARIILQLAGAPQRRASIIKAARKRVLDSGDGDASQACC